VTHPFHPWNGQAFALVRLHKAWGEARVLLSGPDGAVALPAAWTDVLPPDAFVVQAAGRALLRTEDVLRLVQLVRELAKREM
jgi:hypothetical protein